MRMIENATEDSGRRAALIGALIGIYGILLPREIRIIDRAGENLMTLLKQCRASGTPASGRPGVRIGSESGAAIESRAVMAKP